MQWTAGKLYPHCEQHFPCLFLPSLASSRRSRYDGRTTRRNKMRPNPIDCYAYDGNDGYVSSAHVKSHPDRWSNVRAPRATYAEVIRQEKPPARLQKQKIHRFPS